MAYARGAAAAIELLLPQGMAGEKRKVKWIRYLLLAVIGFGLYHILSGPSGAINILRLRRDNEEQRRELDSLEARRRDLETEKLRLRGDSAYLEKVARKELGMAKPGEKVYRFMKKEKSAAEEGR
jgi:cell division protein FtsB